MESLTGTDIKKIRNDFPLLGKTIYNRPLVYFDNGATTQKPQIVIDRIRDLYEHHNATVHRGVHTLSGKMTEAYEMARETVRDFINARRTSEIVFTSGATGSVNLVAFSFGEKYIGEGDEIIVSEMEHHSNIVPWQMLCDRKKAVLKVVPFDENGELIMNEYRRMFSDRTRLVAMVHVSNSLGTVNPVKEIIRIAHENKVPVLLDGAQAIQHGKVDVRDLDADFYVFSGHKVFGPNGIGVLYGKENLLESIPPYQGGGDMVDCVSFEKTTYNDLPLKFEAGTMNYIGAIGLGEALKYVRSIGIDNITSHEQELLDYATEMLASVPEITIYGTAAHKIPVISLLLNKIHHYDTGMILDKMGVAVRTGTHCTQPVMDHFNISGTVRASMVFYNTTEEIEIFVDALKKASAMLH
jgi:cysteine desulfurase/selenocysteine lyase